jgi:signal peptidase I
MTKKPTLVELKENIKTILSAGLLAVAIRTLILEPYHIPSESMVPTLLVGDYLFVNKNAYGYSRYSLPFGPPLFKGRFFFRQPNRGDIVVFQGTYDDRKYIKRLIGLPGDHVKLENGIFHVNGTPLKMTQNGTYMATKLPRQEENNTFVEVPKFLRIFPNGKEHEMIKYFEFGSARMDNMPLGLTEYVVPEGHYFVSGDNMDNSGDSRDLSMMGYIPEENLIGRADLLFYSTNGYAKWWQFWRWPLTVRYERLFHFLK